MTSKPQTSLPDLASKLRQLYGQPVPGGYRKLHMLAADGELPVVRIRGRLYVEDERLPEIARLLGLTHQAPHAA